MNRRAICDAAIFILGGEIRNRTNKHTANAISTPSTPCLSACVNNYSTIKHIFHRLDNGRLRRIDKLAF